VRTGPPNWPPTKARSVYDITGAGDMVLVTSTQYNSVGEAYKSIDPAGREDRREFDDAGRTTKAIQNYTDGDPATGTADQDVTVETTYNADGQVLTLTAKNGTTGDQTTQYVYGTDLGGLTPEVYRNDLLRTEIYPDSDDTTKDSRQNNLTSFSGLVIRRPCRMQPPFDGLNLGTLPWLR